MVASRSSSTISRSLEMALALAIPGTLVRIVGIPIYVGIMASIPEVRVNGKTPVDFRLVVL